MSSPLENVYDCVYVGSGPINCIDSIHEGTQGKSVLLMDRADQIGGAWVAIEVGDYGRLEVGCHIWSYNRKAYDFIRNYFDFEVIHLSPTPQVVKGKTKISYDYKNALTTVKKSLKLAGKLKLGALMTYWKKNPAARVPLLAKKYAYPKGGARDFQLGLEQKLAASSVNSVLGTTIKKLTYRNDVWEVVSEKGEKWFTKKVILTSTSGIDMIQVGEEQLNLRRSSMNYTHFHLIIGGKLKKPLSYLRIMGNDLIHRMSDITYQLESTSGEELTVLLVGVFNDDMTGAMDQQDVEKIMTYLVTNDYLSSEQEVLYSQKNAMGTDYIDVNSLNEVKELSAPIEVLHTTDLMYGIYYALPRWKK